MWRQVFVICLLITLSDISRGVQARLEQEPFEFEDVINDAQRRNFESENEHIKADIPSQAKDVKPPATSGTDPKAPETPAPNGTTHAAKGTPQPLVGSEHKNISPHSSMFGGTDVIFLVTVAACSVAGLIGIIMAGVCWYKLNRSAKAASDAEYPAYGVTGPNKERLPSPGDRKLAQSAQMYHYQHQKQQMIAMEKANGEMKHDASDEESEEENEEGDYTVYECPGLAPTGEMEVKNPLFSDETPVTPSAGDAEKDGEN
ncbi:neural proliferation differentiation and control protein 1-like [Haliotis cracherodii]|uniref:neural proliferation differentiation and control protein 1-like n=1 Tax=Haliotis cracherodii TaxID=6455 RepID=UPI0039EB5B97